MGRRQDVLENAVTELNKIRQGEHSYFQGDVREISACEASAEFIKKKYTHLDILINGAAGNFLSPPEILSPNGFKSIIEIDLIGTFQMCRYLFPLLKIKKSSAILNISATLHYQGTLMQAGVSAAKAGIDALTVNLACEWGKYGVRVLGIAPGPIEDTEGVRKLVPETGRKKLAEETPLKRMGQTQDIAQAALFLLSDGASYITGETLVVDGGQWLYKAPLLSPEELQKFAERIKREKLK